MARVLLINPPKRIYKKAVGFSTYLPLGLLSMAAVIRDICEVKVLDCLVTGFEMQEENGYTLYGMPYEKIREVIKEFNPDIVGVSSLFSYQSQSAVIVAQLCKDYNPAIKVVFGGPDATVRYEHFLKQGPVDFCAVGEGEFTVRELIQHFNEQKPWQGIEGLAYLEDGAVKYKPRKYIIDLDQVPFPAYDLIDMEVYQQNKYFYCNRSEMKRSINIITSRGCPFSCVFCSVHLHMGKLFRYNSPEYVLKHLKLLIEKYNITNFHFEDDNISLNKPRFEQIVDKIIENKLNIRWDTPNGIRADTLNFELLKKIKKSGCIKLKIAIEAGNQEVLNKVVKKATSLAYITDIAKYCKQLGIRSSAFYIIGFPGETVQNMQETTGLALELFRKYDLVPSLHVALPLYGTELYRVSVEKGYLQSPDLTDEDLATGAQPEGRHLLTTPEWGPQDIDNVVQSYLVRLRKGFMFYALKHPWFAVKRIKDNPYFIQHLPIIKQLTY